MSDTLTLGQDRYSRRIAELGLQLPRPVISPTAKIEGYSLAGEWLHVSGQVPQWAGDFRFIGKVGEQFTIETGQQAAHLCALNVLSWAHIALQGDLGRIKKLVRVKGYVSATPDLADVHQVVNGASQLFLDVLGDQGRHARTAIGVAVMPFNVAVEVEATLWVAAAQ